MKKGKHIPKRMCVSCRNMKPKKELIRMVVSDEELLEIDLTGKKSGRGAYICRSEECISKARKEGRIERALKCPKCNDFYDLLKSECLK